MRPKLWSDLGLRVPVFAFSHCRDVVAAVTNAGGIGVYGAALASSEQIDVDLAWIENATSGRPYGVDLLMPSKYVGSEEGELSEVAGRALVPDSHQEFLDDMMIRFGVPEFADAEDGDKVVGGTRYTAQQVEEALEIVFRYNPRLLVSALGTPPKSLTGRARERGMLLGALAGKVSHALAHKRAGVDVVIAQSYEAGGHTGEIGGMVLTPEIVDAVAPTPVLMAGGIGRGSQLAAALALGATGVWCGSVWLTTVESDVPPLMKEKLLQGRSDDTKRTRSFTGKPARFFRTPWVDEWDSPANPDPLPVPVHTIAVDPYLKRIERAAEIPGSRMDRGAGLLVSKPVGQIVGAMNRETTCRQTIADFMEECVAATERMTALLEEAE